MRLLAPISADEMVAHFLRTEIASARFRDSILEILRRERLDRRVVDTPDLSDACENQARARVLGEWRGYRRQKDVFRFVPDDAGWHQCALTRADLASVRYINDDYWIELSGGTRLVIDAAANIRAGIEVFGQSTRWALDFAAKVERGAIFPELILVAEDEQGPVTVLEGHARLTAYCLALEHVPEPLTAIVGLGRGMERV